MEPERLAEALARFRLNSPSPIRTSSPSSQTLPISAYKAAIKDPSSALLQFHYQAFLNPKAMTSSSISARQILKLSNPVNSSFVMITVWPHAAIPSQTIRISPVASRILDVRDGDAIQVVPIKAPPQSLSDENPIHIYVYNRVLSEDQLMQLKFRVTNALPCICSGAELVVPDIGGSGLDARCKVYTKNDREPYALYRPHGVIIVENQDKSSSTLNMEIMPSLGGLQKEINLICDIILLATRLPQELGKSRIQLPKGLLIYGPSGVGKSGVVKVVAHRLKMKLLVIHGSELGAGRYYGEAETQLRDTFATALDTTNTLIFIDNLEVLCPRRDKASSMGSESRVTATLLTLLDGISSKAGGGKGRAFCIASTNDPNAVDNALRRPGRLDKELEIGIPTCTQRLDILRRLLERESVYAETLHETLLEQVAEKTHGFVGADLALVVKEAKLLALSRDDGTLTGNDIISAVAKVRPSALREVALDIPKVSWDDIGGQEQVKQKLRESIELPLKNPGIFTKFGIRPPRGILLYGPPGCSKTMMAKAVATESGLNFFAIKGPEIFSKWVGDSEKAVAEIFRKARMAAPSIVFFDEFDAVGKKRDNSSHGVSVSERVLSQLLSEMDGIHILTDVTVMAATNRPDIIDEALMRPGRFDRHIFISLPDNAARRKILEINTRRINLDVSVCLDKLSQRLEGYSGAEISSLCQEAAIQALIENPDTGSVTMEHFERALHIVKPRTSKSMMRLLEGFSNRSLI